MTKDFLHRFRTASIFVSIVLVCCAQGAVHAADAAPAGDNLITLENEHYRLAIETGTGAITSFHLKAMDCEMIGEKRLADNFRICLPLPDYECNYIDGMRQTPASVEKDGHSVTARFAGMKSDKGTFPVDLTYTITLDGDQVRFHSRLTNRDKRPVSEFWFPRLGGWTRFGSNRGALLATPDYTSCGHGLSLFKHFPGGMGLGSEAAEFSRDYPGMVMPWWSIHDPATNRALYMGYHDETCRLSTWHTYLFPNSTGNAADAFLTADQAKGRPVGLVFSHVRYPFIHSGETFEGGDFILRVHEGDWHPGAKFYRKWFMEHFPFDKSGSWLRKQSAWFTSIIYQPEDRVVADFKTYDKWCDDARRFGINTYELIGWNKGGLERGYPEYVPEEKVGGREGFRQLLSSVHKRNGRVLAFVNYNILDSATDLYKSTLKPYTHQDTFGATPNWMAWGESTLLARKGMNVRRHLLSSVVPPIEKILDDYFVRIVKDGADGFQIDKLVVSTPLDFNPLNTRKPDEAMNQGLVDAIGRLYRKCRAINPEFCLAGEAIQDRLIPYIDVYYRAAGGFSISPLRYAFPEWTACQHVGAPRDFNGVNAALLLGAVLCVEPECYQSSLANPLYEDLAGYIREAERIRGELRDTIFLGDYLDTLEATISEVNVVPNAAPATKAAGFGGEFIIPGGAATFQPVHTGSLQYRAHARKDPRRRAIVVVNTSLQDRAYTWKFLGRQVEKASLYEPFQPVRALNAGDAVRIKAEGFHVLVEGP